MNGERWGVRGPDCDCPAASARESPLLSVSPAYCPPLIPADEPGHEPTMTGRKSCPKPALAWMPQQWKRVWTPLSDGGLDPHVVSPDRASSDPSNPKLWKSKNALLRTRPIPLASGHRTGGREPLKLKLGTSTPQQLKMKAEHRKSPLQGGVWRLVVLDGEQLQGHQRLCRTLAVQLFLSVFSGRRKQSRTSFISAFGSQTAAIVRRAPILQPSSLLHLNFHFSRILPGDHLLKPEQTCTQKQNSSPNPTCYFNLELPGSCSICQCIYSVSITYLSFEVYWMQHK